jgi:hypothetical protein
MKLEDAYIPHTFTADVDQFESGLLRRTFRKRREQLKHCIIQQMHKYIIRRYN